MLFRSGPGGSGLWIPLPLWTPLLKPLLYDIGQPSITFLYVFIYEMGIHLFLLLTFSECQLCARCWRPSERQKRLQLLNSAFWELEEGESEQTLNDAKHHLAVEVIGKIRQGGLEV